MLYDPANTSRVNMNRPLLPLFFFNENEIKNVNYGNYPHNP